MNVQDAEEILSAKAAREQQEAAAEVAVRVAKAEESARLQAEKQKQRLAEGRANTVATVAALQAVVDAFASLSAHTREALDRVLYVEAHKDVGIIGAHTAALRIYSESLAQYDNQSDQS